MAAPGAPPGIPPAVPVPPAIAANPPAFVMFSGYLIGSQKFTTHSGTFCEGFDTRTNKRVNIKVANLTEQPADDKEWAVLMQLEKHRRLDPQSESIIAPLLNVQLLDSVYPMIRISVYELSCINLNRLMHVCKVAGPGKLPLEFACRVFIQMLEGCAFINEKLKSVHGYIEPGAVEFVNTTLITTNTGFPLPVTPKIVLVDFCNLHEVGKRDQEFSAYSLDYKSPEAALGLHIVPSSDVWACACVLYFMIIGEPLFSSHTFLEHLNRIEHLFGQLSPIQLKNHMDYYGVLNLHIKGDGHLGVKQIAGMPLPPPFESRFTTLGEKSAYRILSKALVLNSYTRLNPEDMLTFVEDERKKADSLFNVTPKATQVVMHSASVPNA